MTSVNELLARTLMANAVDTVFGLVGDGNLFMVEAYLKEHGRYVPAYHEASAVLMAQGYSRSTGKVGVATVTHGPGMSNTITPLIEAARARIPIVLITGDTAPSRTDELHLQDIDQRALARVTGAEFIEIAHADRASRELARALQRAVAMRLPVVLNLPYALTLAETDAQVEQQQFTDMTPLGPATSTLDNPLGLIASAQRPLILAGRGSIGYRREVERLAETIGAPLATTLLAKGLFTGSPANVGVLGNLGTELAADLAADSDCLLVFGAGLNQYTTMDGAFLREKPVIQVDIDPEAFNRCSAPHTAVHGDVGVVAAAIHDSLTEAEIPSSNYVSRAEGKPLWSDQSRSAGGAYVDFSAAISTLNEALPVDGVVVLDAGRTAVNAAKLLDVPDPLSWMYTWRGFGSIGLGMASAIGAAVGRPTATTVLVSGDGGFMMGGLTELQTVVNESLDFVIVICNDNAYGFEYIQNDADGLPPKSSRIRTPDLAAVARSFDLDAYTVSFQEDIDGIAPFLERRDGPALIELRLDPGHVPTFFQ